MAASGRDLQLQIRINADGSVAVGQLNAVGTAVGNVGHQAQQSAQSLGLTAEATERLKQALGALAVAGAAAEFVRLNSAVEGHALALEALTGSQAQAAREMAYLGQLADRVGTNAGELTSQYLGLVAATKETGLEGEQTRAIFESVVTAMGRLGRSSAETENALRAVAQMASKGTVSMEELRGQLGEALPGAIQALAREMGVSVQEIGKMIEKGDQLAVDILPKLAAGLDQTFDADKTAQVDSLGASVARLRNALERSLTQPGQNGLADAFQRIVDLGTVGIERMTAGVVLAGKTLGDTAGAVTSLFGTTGAAARGWDIYTQAVADNVDAYNAYLGHAESVVAATGKLTDGADKAGDAHRRLAESLAVEVPTLDDLIAKRDTLARSMEIFTAAQADATNGGIMLGQAQGDLTEAQARMANAIERGVEDVTAYDNVLLAARERVDLLTTAVNGGAKADALATQIKRDLAKANEAVAKAAQQAAEETKAEAAEIERNARLDQASISLKREELEILAARAKARGEDLDAMSLGIDAHRQDIAAVKAAAEAKREEAKVLAERARLLAIDAEARGDNTAKTRDQIAATKDAAAMAELEAKRLDLAAIAKDDAADASARLHDQLLKLQVAFADVGDGSIDTMEEVREAIANAADGGELKALEQALKQAFEAGALAAKEYSDLLKQIKGQQNVLARQVTGRGEINFEALFAEVGSDLGRARAKLGGGAFGVQLLADYQAWLAEQQSGERQTLRPGEPGYARQEAEQQRTEQQRTEQQEAPKTIVRFEFPGRQTVDGRFAPKDADLLTRLVQQASASA